MGRYQRPSKPNTSLTLYPSNNTLLIPARTPSNQAATHHTKRQSVNRTSTDERHYTGLPWGGEWSQLYAQWSRNYQSFMAALPDLYQMPTIYGQETLCFPDISKWKNKLKLEEVSEAQQRDKVKFIDNPYIAGRQKEHLDPHTGLEKPSQQKKANSNGTMNSPANGEGEKPRGTMTTAIVMIDKTTGMIKTTAEDLKTPIPNPQTA
ncbi:hypothetical protein PCASD_08267 [Puccinia coronata f. sp. avenae]|uniref:Uncharacterized protein n=1 Tax=Puccinia coronata f. sp. avenae TaxID=200324 RepID=A0A2N5V195_9BASI|nr:hypothetical protein PCASD_08267 [Puccinia coronata f. sp. avenae]